MTLCLLCAPLRLAAGPEGLCHAHSFRDYPVLPGTSWRPTIEVTR